MLLYLKYNDHMVWVPHTKVRSLVLKEVFSCHSREEEQKRKPQNVKIGNL